jgi:hypothetical protein
MKILVAQGGIILAARASDPLRKVTLTISLSFSFGQIRICQDSAPSKYQNKRQSPTLSDMFSK